MCVGRCVCGEVYVWGGVCVGRCVCGEVYVWGGVCVGSNDRDTGRWIAHMRGLMSNSLHTKYAI